MRATTSRPHCVGRSGDGTPRGVGADPSADFATSLGLPLAFTLFPNADAAAAARRAGTIDGTSTVRRTGLPVGATFAIGFGRDGEAIDHRPFPFERVRAILGRTGGWMR